MVFIEEGSGWEEGHYQLVVSLTKRLSMLERKRGTGGNTSWVRPG